MAKTLPLLRGRITLEDALAEDVDMVHELSFFQKRYDFWRFLCDHSQDIKHVAAQHLNVPPSELTVAETKEWNHGSFNACIPIRIRASSQTRHLPRQAMVRFALPYKVGDEFHPGNVDEKVRTEAATYIWMVQNCPDVPIPRLFGFGLPGKQSFTLSTHRPFHQRVLWTIRRVIAWLCRRTGPSFYIPHDRVQLPQVGYMVLEYVDRGQMLSATWEEQRHDISRRANLFCDLSRIMLCMARLPMPRIGSWTVDNHGTLSLTNRPLTLLLCQLENAGIPTHMARNDTYTAVEPYFLDLLAGHDNRMRLQPNAIHNQEDGEEQLAALAAMRAILPAMVDRDTRRCGPFVMTLTDLHASNIFVNDDWHVTCILDLEWTCARPAAMLGPPGWLTSLSLEEIAFQYEAYQAMHTEFVAAVEEQESKAETGTESFGSLHLANTEQETQKQKQTLGLSRPPLCSRLGLADMMRQSWQTKSFWYFRALDSPTMLLGLYLDHIQPQFARIGTDEWRQSSRVLTSLLWDRDASSFVSRKVDEQSQYNKRLEAIFAADDGSFETK